MQFTVETESDCVANTAGEGVVHGACGMLGGEDGQAHRYLMHTAEQTTIELKTKQEGLHVPAGSSFEVHSGGGGGWGDPNKREQIARENDLQNGITTGAKA